MSNEILFNLVLPKETMRLIIDSLGMNPEATTLYKMMENDYALGILQEELGTLLNEGMEAGYEYFNPNPDLKIN